MSAQHWRILVALSNLCLIGLIAWVTWDTFWQVDKEKFDPRHVPLRKLHNSLAQRKDRTEQRTLAQYAVIWNTLGRKYVRPKPEETTVEVEETRPQPSGQLEAPAVFIDADNPKNSSAILRHKRSGVEKSFMVGQALESRKGFEGLRGYVLKEIRPEDPEADPNETSYVVVLENKKGETIEVRGR